MESLSVVPVSQASANQRKGRAGRVSSGMCLRLFTEENFGSLEKESAPEIKRVNISSVILLLKTLNVEDVSSFPYLDPPPRDASNFLLLIDQLLGLWKIYLFWVH